jgi:hypothetical protein
MSESLKINKKIISTASIIAICVLVCLFLMFVVLDLLRIFWIKNKVSIKSLKWNKRLLHQNYNLKNKKNKTNRLNPVGITYLAFFVFG